MRPIYEDRNISYNIVSDILNFNSQVRFGNIPNRHYQHVRLYRSRRVNLYKEPTGFPNSRDGLQA